MAKKSLRHRLTFSIATTLGVFLALVGFILENAFIESVESGIENAQDSRIDALVAYIDDENPAALTLPDDLPGDNYEQISSGVYAFLLNSQLKTIWQSGSVTSQVWRLPNIQEPGQRVFLTPNEVGQEFYATLIDTLWGDEGYRYTLVVAEDKRRYQATIDEFRKHLWGWLVAVIVLLIAILLTLLRWGLWPLKEVSDALAEIESGKKDHIKGDYPEEIKRLTDNINTLLTSERNQRQRYRDSLADLAHSLKTPLAVLQSTADGSRQLDELKLTLVAQVDRMNQIVSHQLRRAVIAGKASFQAPIDVKPVVEKIIFALKKVYQRKGIDFEYCVDERCRFVGDEADLMEVLGNVLENAAKYGKKKVLCNISDRERSTSIPGISVSIEDDGPGIEKSARESVLRRGQRIDEQKEGQGIGLAVVSDIIDDYGGQIRIEDTQLGGAKFTILL